MEVLGGDRDSTLSIDAAFRKVYADSSARKRMEDRFNWVFNGVSHADNIYRRLD